MSLSNSPQAYQLKTTFVLYFYETFSYELLFRERWLFYIAYKKDLNIVLLIKLRKKISGTCGVKHLIALTGLRDGYRSTYNARNFTTMIARMKGECTRFKYPRM